MLHDFYRINSAHYLFPKRKHTSLQQEQRVLLPLMLWVGLGWLLGEWSGWLEREELKSM